MSDDKPESEKPEATSAVASDAPASKPATDPEGSVATTETTPTKAEAAELEMATGGKPDEPVRDSVDDEDDDDEDSEPAAAAAPDHGHGHGHGHGAHGHDAHAHGDHGLAHTMPVPMLIGVLVALLVLTVATVAVTSVDLGAQGNLIVAMVIATVKAILVCAFFMHLLWDKKFNLVLFLTSVLFLVLFLSMTTTDRGEYQHLVDEYRAQQLAK
jgi:cytochrome c oxidase subunit IV